MWRCADLTSSHDRLARAVSPDDQRVRHHQVEQSTDRYASGTEKQSYRVHCFGHLVIRFGAALVDRGRDAMTQVVIHQPDCDPLQRLRRSGNLGQHVDAVPIVLDHPSDPTNLTLDPFQTLEEQFLVGFVPSHASTITVSHIPPMGIADDHSTP